MRKLLFLLLFGGLVSTYWAQSVETFEGETIGATSFTLDSKTYSVSGTLFDIESWPGNAANGSNTLLDNYDATNSTVEANPIVRISKTTDNFYLNSLYLFLGSPSSSPSGDVTIKGKLSSGVQFTHTVSSPTPYTWFKEDMSAYNSMAIDELEFQLGGNLTYIGIDDLELSVVALPVELTSFTAAVSNGKVKLNWQTATEVNNYGFEIERQNSVSSSQKSEQKWEKIGFIEGAGNSNSPREYSYTDESNQSGTFQYRLKQIDIDGKFEYSETAEVTINSLPNKFELQQNYPNPFNPSTVIQYSIPVVDALSGVEAQHVTFKVYDILGNIVATLVNKNQEAGNYEVEFNASNLATGMYIYQLNAGSYKSVKKMMLLK